MATQPCEFTKKQTKKPKMNFMVYKFSLNFFKKWRKKKLIATRKLQRDTLADVVDTKQPKKWVHSRKWGTHRSMKKSLWNYVWNLSNMLGLVQRNKGLYTVITYPQFEAEETQTAWGELVIFHKWTKEPSLKQEAWVSMTAVTWVTSPHLDRTQWLVTQMPH